ncbi:protein-L-isoaspartate O-methyltransferase [Camelimonas abortus]|uniref:Protein-L-isoaspartate O-methyltransferase n=1 Tax=Camelimonas abortus TaxID=1017184 RepID=A0ABV7LH49_9HYPH
MAALAGVEERGLAAREETAAFLLALRSRGVRDTAILRAMELAPREMFAPRGFADLARADVSLPLPCGQTMTSPVQLAVMLGELAVTRAHRVLEVGSGSGYLTAVLAHLAGEVVSLERLRTLGIAAASRIARLGLDNARVEIADGLAGDAGRWGRFDRIILNGALEHAPPALVAALNDGGRMVGAILTPPGPRLVCVERRGDAFPERLGGPLRLPPLQPGLAQAL